jgi:SAM-dependent methyltransferase
MHAHLDHPSDTEVVDRFGFHAIGWLWLGKQHHRIAAVEIWSGTERIGESGTLTFRPDVCAALGIDSTALTGVTLLAFHPKAPRGARIEVAIRARLADGTRTEPLFTRSVRCYGFDDPPRTAQLASDDEVRARPSVTDRWAPPPPPLQVRQVGGDWGAAFYREGRVIMNQLAAAFADAGMPLERAGAILDFGCGSGRVLSAFADSKPAGEVWGCDIDAEAIAWNEANLGQLARFQANPVLPPTRFDDGQFDAIYSVSVFTHLPEDLQFVWLNELRRVLRPGGVLVASLHGSHYHRQADPDTRAEVATRGFAYRTGPPTAGLPDFYMLAMHSEAYVRSRWTRYLEFVELRERYVHGVHDAAVLRRRAD